MTNDQIKLAFALAKNKGCRFVSLKYTNQKGEQAKHQILIGVDYAAAQQKDLDVLKMLKEQAIMDDIHEQALDELIAGIEKSQAKTVTEKVEESPYEIVAPGLKQHKDTGSFYLYGFSRSKTVLKEGEKITTVSSQLTIAKNEIRKFLRTDRYRQFKFDEIKVCRVNGNEFELEN